LKLYQKKIIEDSEGNEFWINVLSLIVTGVLILINLLLSKLLEFFCKLELHYCKTNLNLSFIQKLSRLQLINTCAVIVIAHIVLFEEKGDIFRPGGIMYEASYMLIWKMVSSAAMSFMLPMHLWKKFKKMRFLKNMKKSPLLQYEANLLFTGAKIHPGKLFAFPVNFLHLVSFFLPIVPLGSVCLLVGCLSKYFAMKYLFARIYERPEELGVRIALDSIYRLGYSPIILYVSFQKSPYIFFP
jgi:hypothetical protein